MGAAINLVNNFKIKNVIFNCGEFNKLETNLINELKSKNIKVGIISDTTHSLSYTLQALGIGNYIDAYTCSKEVGVIPIPTI